MNQSRRLAFYERPPICLLSQAGIDADRPSTVVEIGHKHVLSSDGHSHHAQPQHCTLAEHRHDKSFRSRHNCLTHLAFRSQTMKRKAPSTTRLRLLSVFEAGEFSCIPEAANFVVLGNHCPWNPLEEPVVETQAKGHVS